MLMLFVSLQPGEPDLSRAEREPDPDASADIAETDEAGEARLGRQ